jgi:hypothetical protein
MLDRLIAGESARQVCDALFADDGDRHVSSLAAGV